jgi:hypothetical protein
MPPAARRPVGARRFTSSKKSRSITIRFASSSSISIVTKRWPSGETS